MSARPTTSRRYAIDELRERVDGLAGEVELAEPDHLVGLAAPAGPVADDPRGRQLHGPRGGVHGGAVQVDDEVAQRRAPRHRRADPVRRTELHGVTRGERAARHRPAAGRAPAVGRVERGHLTAERHPISRVRLVEPERITGADGRAVRHRGNGGRAHQERGDSLGLAAGRADPDPDRHPGRANRPDQRLGVDVQRTTGRDVDDEQRGGVGVGAPDRVADQRSVRWVDDPVDLDDRDARLCIGTGGPRLRARRRHSAARGPRRAARAGLRSRRGARRRRGDWSESELRRCIKAPVASG